MAAPGRADFLTRPTRLHCTILIGPADLLPLLKERAADPSVELVAFAETEALKALEAITKRRPQVVTLERAFAATTRGAALINRIKADQTLNDSEIRIVAHDSDHVEVSPRRSVKPPPEKVTTKKAAAAVHAAPAAAPPLDFRGTRRAPRFRLAGTATILVDGNSAQLIDLSTMGAQLVSPTSLRPNQRVRLALPDEAGQVRFNGVVAWASFEIPRNAGPRYRAGVEFADADASAVDAFIKRHKA